MERDNRIECADNCLCELTGKRVNRVCLHVSHNSLDLLRRILTPLWMYSFA